MKSILKMGCCLLLLLCICSFGCTVSAAEPYDTYTYRSDKTAQLTPMAYAPVQTVTGEDLGIEAFHNPSDLTVRDGECFLFDGTGAILVLDEKLALKRTVWPKDPAGEPIVFEETSGIYVARDGRIMAADKKGGKVYVMDREGCLLQTLGKPDSSLLDKDFFFEPLKITEDSGGVLYVISQGSYQGALQYDRDGSFLGFYGSEKVTLTPAVLLDYMWKQILNADQTAGMKRAQPVEFVSFDMDDKDFIYTVRQGNDVTTDQVRRLNAKGQNILKSGVYGDYDRRAMLADICVDHQGFFTILDNDTGKLFQYAENGRLLYVFGGQGPTDGCFVNPVALTAFGDRVLVLDSTKNSITSFAPTAFAAHIRKAVCLEKTGSYLEAEADWQAVLKQDFRYELAGIGLGKAAEKRGDYDEAMDYYRIGHDRTLYSGAFGKVRDAFIRSYLGWFLAGAAVLLLAFGVIGHFRKKKKKEIYGGGRKKSRYPFYCLLHPIAGFEDMKDEKSGDWRIATVILAAFFGVTVLMERATGFIFNQHGTEDFNLLVTLLSGVGLFLVFVLCNWAVTTIAEGKGSLKEIYTFCSYALMPFILGGLFLVLASLVLTEDEAAFYQIFRGVVFGWSVLQMFLALRAVQMYTMAKNFWTIVATLLGMVVIVVICAIIYSVFSQFIGFLGSAVIGELIR